MKLITTTTVLAVVSLFVVSPAVSTAAITPLSHWRMGEEAGDTDGRLDSVGGRTFATAHGPTEFTTGVAPSTNGSTVAVNARNAGGRAGFYGPNTTTFMPADNWGMEMWVRSANTTQSIDITRPANALANGQLKFHQLGANWAVSYHNIGWVGATSGTGQPVTAEQWTHLAVVRAGGTSTLYIDGVAQAGTSGAAPTWGTSLHVGVIPGGATGWNGDLDELRVFSFNAGEFQTSDLLVPEPATCMLAALGSLVLAARRRRRR